MPEEYIAVDRKAALMVQELKKYKMNVVDISEVKWFWSAVYNGDGYTYYFIPGVLYQKMPRG